MALEMYLVLKEDLQMVLACSQQQKNNDENV